MATTAVPLPRVRERHSWWHWLWSWITTVDHKKIGIMYVLTALLFFLVGGVDALLIRLQLGTPENTLLSPRVYNEIFTMHGTTMIFLSLMPFNVGLANF